ncbi:MAG: SGNH/GDSL hydrolase family protein, partial [Pyrinomonadaceae bacterium]|nr:SGNH/GDSL hydrolase family protein [Sphingobacteriaceae bacterium]
MFKAILVPLIFLSVACKNQESPILTASYERQSGAIKSFSYLALGDSYTIGHGVSAESSFPYQLSASLNKEGWKADPLTIVAQTGWTTSDLINAIKSRGITTKFDIITLLIGVNNQYRGYSTTAYRQEFIQLLNTALTYANGDKTKVFVISIPDWGVTPFASGSDRSQIAKEIDEFNAINREETLKAGIDYIDITPISRKASNDRSLIADDGLHPSGKMYML